jgi:hypothetical protein
VTRRAFRRWRISRDEEAGNEGGGDPIVDSQAAAAISVVLPFLCLQLLQMSEG